MKTFFLKKELFALHVCVPEYVYHVHVGASGVQIDPVHRAPFKHQVWRSRSESMV